MATSVLDQIESTNICAGKVILEQNDIIMEELNPSKYQFLLNITFVPQTFTIKWVHRFTEDLKYIFDANLSDYEIFLRDMNCEYPPSIYKIPIIEQDNLKMLEASRLERSFILRNDKEVWLFAQFNMPAKARVIFRLFGEICRICRKYDVSNKDYYTGFRLHKRHMEFSNYGATVVQDYAKFCYEHNIEVDPKIVASCVTPITIVYNFKTEIVNDWKDLIDFEYIIDCKIDTIGFAKGICNDMFECDIEQDILRFSNLRTSKFEYKGWLKHRNVRS